MTSPLSLQGTVPGNRIRVSDRSPLGRGNGERSSEGTPGNAGERSGERSRRHFLPTNERTRENVKDGSARSGSRIDVSLFYETPDGRQNVVPLPFDPFEDRASVHSVPVRRRAFQEPRHAIHED